MKDTRLTGLIDTISNRHRATPVQVRIDRQPRGTILLLELRKNSASLSRTSPVQDPQKTRQPG